MKQERGEITAAVLLLALIAGLSGYLAYTLGEKEGELKALEKQNNEKAIIYIERAPSYAQEREEGKRE